MTTRMIWCWECTCENWDEVSDWKWQGRAATQSGRLKVAAKCRSCEAELSAGERAEAIALQSTEDAIDWAREYLEFDGEYEEAEAGPAPVLKEFDPEEL